MYHLTRGGRRGHPESNPASPTTASMPNSPLSPRKRSRSRSKSRKRLSRFGSFNESVDALPAYLLYKASDIDRKFIEINQRERERALQTHDDDAARARDRYSNIRPWVNNACLLKVPQGCNPYINASPIELRSKTLGVKKWIATQGPLDNQFHHFWRLIWQETSSVAVIVMLTPCSDTTGTPKCAQYFPLQPPTTWTLTDPSDPTSFTATLTCTELLTNKRAGAQLRRLTLQLGTQQKTIWHILFEAWPDHGVPKDPLHRRALVELIKVANEKNSAPENPVIVHCSAGVGRSGTYIALDHFLREIDAGKLPGQGNPNPLDDPVFEVVDTLRQQRTMMVQTSDQLKFLYAMVRERYAAAIAARDAPPLPRTGSWGNGNAGANGAAPAPGRPGLRSAESFLGL